MMPTACWKLDWEELEVNNDNFYALCQLLREKVGNLTVTRILFWCEGLLIIGLPVLLVNQLFNILMLTKALVLFVSKNP